MDIPRCQEPSEVLWEANEGRRNENQRHKGYQMLCSRHMASGIKISKAGVRVGGRLKMLLVLFLTPKKPE